MAKPKQELTQASVQHYFHYDPETGHFSRAVSVQGASVGRKPHVRADGYARLRFAGAEHYVHRLAWLYVHGALPAAFIDHIDGNPSNNAIKNLREVTHAQNMQNVACVTGVSFYRPKGTWRCRLNVDGRTVVNSYHKTQEAARDAYINAKRQFHQFAVL